MEPAAGKIELRMQMRERLRTLEPEDAARASARIVALLEALLATIDGPVLSFEPIRRSAPDTPERLEETDLGPLNEALIQQTRLALPRIDWENRTMQAVLPAFSPGDPRDRWLEVRRHAVPEPREGEVIEPTVLAAVLVPGLAFDWSGARLGRGAGFYDRFLESVGPRTHLIGVCFAMQVAERVPTESHDRCVATLVHEGGVVTCS